MVSTLRMEEPVSRNVHDVIRSELKKIVQMQHDTVMNFLNGGSQVTARNDQVDNGYHGINQQLGTLIKICENNCSGWTLGKFT